MTNFQLGDVVVSVAEDANCPDFHLHSDQTAASGGVFRVVDLDTDPSWVVPGLFLAPNPSSDPDEPWFCACGFRKSTHQDEGVGMTPNQIMADKGWDKGWALPVYAGRFGLLRTEPLRVSALREPPANARRGA